MRVPYKNILLVMLLGIAGLTLTSCGKNSGTTAGGEEEKILYTVGVRRIRLARSICVSHRLSTSRRHRQCGHY